MAATTRKGKKKKKFECVTIIIETFRPRFRSVSGVAMPSTFNRASAFNFFVCYCHYEFSFLCCCNCLAVVGKHETCRRTANLPFTARPSVDAEYKMNSLFSPSCRSESFKQKIGHFLAVFLLSPSRKSLWGLIKNQWVIIGENSLKYTVAATG